MSETSEFSVEHGPAGRGALPRAVMLLVKTGGASLRLELAVDFDPLPFHACVIGPGGEAEVHALAPTETPGGTIAYASFEAQGPRARIELVGPAGLIADLSFDVDFATQSLAPCAAPADPWAAVAPPDATLEGTPRLDALERPGGDHGAAGGDAETPTIAPGAPVRRANLDAPTVDSPAPAAPSDPGRSRQPSLRNLLDSSAGTAPQDPRSTPWAVSAQAPPSPRSTPSRPAGAPNAAAADVPFRRRASAGRRTKVAWPQTLGDAGKHLGPPSSVDGTPVLALEAIERTGTGVHVELSLDDQGLIASIVIARRGEELVTVNPRRLTSIGPTRVRITVPDAAPTLVLIGRNAYGEAFSNVVAALDLERGQFCPFQPERAVWGHALVLAPPLEMERTTCAACRAEVDLRTAPAWTSFSPEDREALRAQYALTPQSRGLCTKCHEELILSQRVLHIIGQLFTSKGLVTLVERLFFAYLGALAVLTPPGALLARFLNASLELGFQDWVSYDLSGALIAAALAVLPWPTWIAECVEGWKRYLKGRRSASAAPFVVPLAIGLLIWAGARSVVPAPAWYADWFFKVHLHVAAWLGLVVAVLATVAFGRLVDREALARLVPHRRVLQLGKAGRLMPQLFASGARSDYERTVDAILMDGLGALEFQAFALDDSGRLALVRSVGRFRAQVADLHFRPGDAHILGVTAEVGYPTTPDDVGKDRGIDPARLQMKIPSLLCIPVWAGGEVAEVYNVSRLRASAVAEDTLGLAEVLALTAGRCLNRILADAAEEE